MKFFKEFKSLVVKLVEFVPFDVIYRRGFKPFEDGFLSEKIVHVFIIHKVQLLFGKTSGKGSIP
ncbi:MAG: hypothetical protein AUJ60_02505 [Nitrospirae bacterium CG1_02_44_142]|nr:MAG: hypothetical protein AUJ60_02505 [Nitrospirae bacterium CG1_02_44_142]